ncbi:hypothetical protein L6452_17398 [Arctium lappa]|uniref:Uncharacterized protein n=1 Tax=Arctium lappa TaxID=4217 RepID=A0ACB9C3A3_ARCLA|nr:hypothetical protein L6452_17398 [Arctium lappa]
MNLLLRRHHSSLAPFNLRPTIEHDIVSLCKSNLLFDAIHLLNSIHSHKCFTKKPILYAILLQTCTKSNSFNHGLQLHSHVIKTGLETDRFVGNSLLALYFKLSSDFIETRRVFDGLYFKDVVSWTSMISGFIRVGKPRNDLYQEALGFFFSMMRKYGMSADGFTFGSVLTACGNLGRLKQGKEVHSKLITSGIHDNVVVDSSLVDMYGKCGSLDESQRVFDRMTKRNSVSWCALLGGYCQKGHFDTVIDLFRQMEEIDLYSFGTIIRACAGVFGISVLAAVPT